MSQEPQDQIPGLNDFAISKRSTKKVNYNEKKADLELEKSIKAIEKAQSNTASSKRKSANESTTATNSSKTAKKNGADSKGRVSKKTANGASAGTKSATKDGKKITDAYINKIISDKSVPWNIIPSLPHAYRKFSRFSNMLNLDDAMVDLKKQQLYTPGSSGSKKEVLLTVDEHIYMVSEPPGEPYYVGRVMGFVPKTEFHKQINSCSTTNIFPAAYINIKMNWYYRQRDISDNLNKVDPRVVYGSLHTDVCPLHSFRGKCTVTYKNDIAKQFSSISEYITKPNHFYFDQLFDRYTGEYYSMHSTARLLETLKLDSNKTSEYLKILASMYPYIYCEPKFPIDSFIEKYILNHKVEDSNKYDQIWDLRCGECCEWCNNSGQYIQCEGCGQPYHIYCLNPPLERKPNKDVIWICSDCISKDNLHFENTDHQKAEIPPFKSKVASSDFEALATSLSKSDPCMKESINRDNWWFQYFGSFIVNNIESCITFNCPFPFKTNRLGVSRYQYRFPEDQPAVARPLSKRSTPDQIKDKSSDSVKEDEPVKRGGNETVTVLWDWDQTKISESQLDAYIEKCIKVLPTQKDFSPNEANFRDYLCKALMDNDFDTEKAFAQCTSSLSREILEIPSFNDEELKVFEQEVAKYGSELKPVCQAMETQPMSMVVKYFYIWKKTEQGLKVRGKWEKKLKAANLKKNPKLDKEWKYIDDSSVELDSLPKETTFSCSFCNNDFSPMWYKITGCSSKVSKDSSEPPHLESLCIRCARLWRRYAVRWDTPSNILKTLHGAHVSSFKAVVSEVLSDSGESNQYVIKTPASLAFQKNIEWELVLDSELILKQKELMFLDSSKTVKYKKNMMGVRTSMIKPLTQLVDNSNLNTEVLEGKLAKYVSKTQKTGTPKAAKTRTPPIEKSETETSKVENNVSAANSAATPVAKNKLVKVESVKSSSNSTGASKANFLKIECSLPNNEKCELIVDPEFKTVRIANISELFKNKTEDYFAPIVPVISNEKEVKELLQNLQKQEAQKEHDYNLLLLDGTRETLLKVYHQYALEAMKSGAFSDIAIKRNKVRVSSYRENIVGKSSSNSIQLRTACSVCMGNMSCEELETQEIICHNCGMNCHYYCYGKPVSTVGSKWLCDPCSNDAEKVVNQDYACCLCISKEIDYDACRKLSKSAIPDALKRTDTNRWAHVICALYQPGVSVGNPSLQPLQHIKHICKSQKCAICSNTSGSVIKCEQCDNRFHVTCAQDEKGFQLGFASEASVSPVLLCSAHDSPKLLPLNHTTADQKTLWEKYLQTVIDRHISSSENPALNNSHQHCAKCGTMESIYWYPNGVCRSCRVEELYPEFASSIHARHHVIINKEIHPYSEEEKQQFLAGIDPTKFQTHFMKTKMKTSNKKRSHVEDDNLKLPKKNKI